MAPYVQLRHLSQQFAKLMEDLTCQKNNHSHSHIIVFGAYRLVGSRGCRLSPTQKMHKNISVVAADVQFRFPQSEATSFALLLFFKSHPLFYLAREQLHDKTSVTTCYKLRLTIYINLCIYNSLFLHATKLAWITINDQSM